MSNNKASYDLAIIGGGINGVGIAADAAGRGLKVLLVEQQDLASATSSWSSKLIHGGLRYLEHYEFRLVKEALAERDILLRKAPHIIEPLKFILPHHPTMRPTWMLKAGLFMYDNLNFFKSSKLAHSESVNFKKWGSNPLISDYTKGFSYFDCFVDDSRLVVLNAIDAKARGADIRTYTRCTGANFDKKSKLWQLDLQLCQPLDDDMLELAATADQEEEVLINVHPTSIVKAKAIVNAAGPWVQEFLEQKLKRHSPRKIRLIKGSHIILPKLHEGPEAFILQNTDKRVVFVIPYRGMSLVGTTDRVHKAPAEAATIDHYEIEYLLDTVNQYFQTKRNRVDILFTYSGVRPLCDDESDDPSAITRDYTLTFEQEPGPLLSVFGGKLTTFRKLAEAALKKLAPVFPHMQPGWTATEPLPGGNQTSTELDQALSQNYPWLGCELRQRYVKSYGTLAYKILGRAKSLKDLGALVMADAYEREIQYLVLHEFAKNPNDILWRRSKLGYQLGDPKTNKEQITAIHQHLIRIIQRVQRADD